MKIEIPYKLPLTANARRGRGWHAASTRAATQRRMASLAVLASDEQPTLPVVVTLTRVGKGNPDWDNVVAAFKHIRDGIADALGTRDNDPRIEWRYTTRKAKDYAIEISIEARQ